MTRCRFDLVPGIHKRLWIRIAQRLQAPDFRYTRKVGLLHEPCIPDITTQITVAYVVHSRKDNCLKFFFKDTIAKKRLHPCFTHLCPVCHGDDLRIHLSEAISVCANCGDSQDYIDDSVASYCQSFGPCTSMGSEVQVHPRQHVLCYHKRKNHFKYWLARMQGKESNRLTREIIGTVEKEILRFHARPCYDSIREALKRLHLHRFYNNIYSIQRSLIGHGLLELSRRQEERLIGMFVQIQGPFAAHAGLRVNMIYYSYLIRKMSEILKWPSVAKVMPPLKSVTKTRHLDQLWALICNDLGFPFIRTV